MFRRIRFAVALVILAFVASGSLGALPPSTRAVSIESGRGGLLTAVVEWIASLLALDREVPNPPPPTKEGSGYDPSGGH